MRRVLSIFLTLFFVHVSAASSAAFSFSNDSVKAVSLVLMVLTTEGLFARHCAITTGKISSFDPLVAK